MKEESKVGRGRKEVRKLLTASSSQIITHSITGDNQPEVNNHLHGLPS
jgi:hypothetical protein